MKEVWICGQLTGKYVGASTPWEFQGVFDSEQKAIAACRDENYFIYSAIMNQELPDESVEPDGRYPLHPNDNDKQIKPIICDDGIHCGECLNITPYGQQEDLTAKCALSGNDLQWHDYWIAECDTEVNLPEK